MGRESTRVLVIDDDEVVLIAISDLLERQGYRVYTQISPIGATQVIVRERIDAAVIDVNLPEMQGDSVVRLIRTWDRLKDLPIILVSGASVSRLSEIKRNLPEIQIVSKSTMHRNLVRTLEEVLTEASRRKASRNQGNDQGSEGTRDLVALLIEELAKGMLFARQVWSQVGAGRMDQVARLSSVLLSLQRHTQLLDLHLVSQMLECILDVLDLVKPGVRPPPRVHRNVDDAFTALAAIRRARDLDPDSAVSQQLASIARDLRTGSSS